MKPWLAILAVASIAVPTAAEAALSITKTTRDTLDTGFEPGDGNPNTDFAITRIAEDNGNTIEIGVKAKERFVGQTNVGGSGTTYIVQPGVSTQSATNLTPDPDRAWWNFDFSVDLGSRNLGDTDVIMSIVDPEGDSYSLDFGSDDETSLLQSSWNIGFGFINDATFDGDPLGNGGLEGFKPFLYGNYDIDFAVKELDGTALGSQEITAQVVPLPAAAALFVPGLVSIALVARRRQNRAAA